MNIFGKTAVFRADMAGLGKYSKGGYGRIGVYRVIPRCASKTKGAHCDYNYLVIHGYTVWPTLSKRVCILAPSRILSSTLWGEYLVPDFPTEAFRLCARGKGCGLSIKGDPCKRVSSSQRPTAHTVDFREGEELTTGMPTTCVYEYS